MTTPELKPCPFCGETQPPHDDTSWVRCLGCGAETGWQPTGDEAIAAWNRRAALEPQPDQTVEIDLRVAMMEELEKAASESPWVPKEYYMNEVISDCCAFLREDRTPQGDYFEGLEEGIKIGRGEPQPISKSADLHDPRDEVIARLVEALTKMRALMCEAIEDDDGNSGCGQCVNDCTGCIAHAALAAAKAVQK